MKTTFTTLSAAAIAFAAVSGGLVGVAKAESVADFFKGKTVTIYVGLAPGGIYSNYAQMMAPHFSKHIPGNPTVIVKHQPGAGGLSALNYVYNVASKDGLNLITPNSGMSKRVALGEPGAKFDPRKLNWLGGWGEAVNVCSVFKTAPATSIEEAKQKQDVFGTIGKSSTTYTNPTILNHMLGTKFKLISGYRGGSPIRLAMEKGEIDGWCGQYLGWKQQKPDWLREGKLVHLVQFASKRSPDLPNVRLLSDFATNAEEKQIFSFVQGGLDDRALAAPPGVPADRVAALEKAYIDTMKDPEFLKDAKKLKLEVNIVTGKEIADFVNQVMSLKKTTVDKLNAAMGKE